MNKSGRPPRVFLETDYLRHFLGRDRRQFALLLTAIERDGGFENGRELLLAITQWGVHGIALPAWIIKDIAGRLNRLYETKDWNAALGKPFPRYNLAKKSRRDDLRPKVFAAITEIKQANRATPVDVALFEKVGKKFKIGATLCARLYYEEGMRRKFLLAQGIQAPVARNVLFVSSGRVLPYSATDESVVQDFAGAMRKARPKRVARAARRDRSTFA